jgi:hypothetical protein
MNESAIVYILMGCLCFGVGTLESSSLLQMVGFIMFGVGAWILGYPDSYGRKHEK